MAESGELQSTIQSWVEVQHNLGCMLAGLGSLHVRMERWAAAGQEAVEGTLAGRGWMQPGCKASGSEGSKDRLDTERKTWKEGERAENA